ncbi:MAG: hypothetical protein LBI33_07275 [Propionibacteriaceae bacterium]|nr:hypothetical protein [Propionibacteriaceae bacterium]
MKSLRKAVAVAVLGAGLAGCAPGGEVTPSPSTGESMAVVVTETPSPTPLPTPQWDEEEQGAVDAVQRYLEVWTHISQDPTGADWVEIQDVANSDALDAALDTWNRWASKGWHLVGGPTFEPKSVSKGARGINGQLLHVRGCYTLEGGYLVDSSGSQLAKSGAPRTISLFEVLHNERRYVVLEDNPGEETC